MPRIERVSSSVDELTSVVSARFDHPFAAAYLRTFRELPREELRLCVQSPDGTEGVAAAWAIEARGDKGAG
jgi:hypothetical protein